MKNKKAMAMAKILKIALLIAIFLLLLFGITFLVRNIWSAF